MAAQCTTKICLHKTGMNFSNIMKKNIKFSKKKKIKNNRKNKNNFFFFFLSYIFL